MATLGISKDDLKKKSKIDFDDGTIEEEVIQIRYKFNQVRLMHAVNKLLEVRHIAKNLNNSLMSSTMAVTSRYSK